MNLELANTLPNGAQILSRYKLPPYYNQDGKPTWVVLCYWEDNPTPYVTWRADNEGNTFWGSYHKTYDEAQLRFEMRLEELCQYAVESV